MIDLTLSKPDVRLLLKALHSPSVTDPKAADVYDYLQRMLDDAAPTAPWQTVVGASGSGAYRGNGVAVNLKLECGHAVRELGSSDYEIKRRLGRGEVIRRRCRECAGGPPRRANP